MLLFCNVSLRLTSDTLSRVNNESDGPHVQGIEEARWHMAERMKRAEPTLATSRPPSPSHLFLSSTTFSQPKVYCLTYWFGHFWLGWPCLSSIQLSIICPSLIPQCSGKNLSSGNGWIKQEVLRGRWGTLASGCSSQLLCNLEYIYIKKLGDPQPLGSCTVKKKKKNPSLCFMNN